MQLGIIVETNDPERVWNGFRFATAALDEGHDVEAFLLGDGVEAPDLDHEAFNPHGVLAKFARDGGDLFACGTCLDSRDLDAGELRPRATMAELVRIVEDADRVVTFG
ncbi:MAG: DsrE family protein [Halobacteriaceae archaeon]